MIALLVSLALVSPASGSTVVAAQDYGAKAIGIETERRYLDLAASRLGQMSMIEGAA